MLDDNKLSLKERIIYSKLGKDIKGKWNKLSSKEKMLFIYIGNNTALFGIIMLLFLGSHFSALLLAVLYLWKVTPNVVDEYLYYFEKYSKEKGDSYYLENKDNIVVDKEVKKFNLLNKAIKYHNRFMVFTFCISTVLLLGFNNVFTFWFFFISLFGNVALSNYIDFNRYFMIDVLKKCDKEIVNEELEKNKDNKINKSSSKSNKRKYVLTKESFVGKIKNKAKNVCNDFSDFRSLNEEMRNVNKKAKSRVRKRK